MWQPTTHWAEIFPVVPLIRRKAILTAASRPSVGRETVECRGLLGVNTSGNARSRHGFDRQRPKCGRPPRDSATSRQGKDPSTPSVALPRHSPGFQPARLTPAHDRSEVPGPPYGAAADLRRRWSTLPATSAAFVPGEWTGLLIWARPVSRQAPGVRQATTGSLNGRTRYQHPWGAGTGSATWTRN